MGACGERVEGGREDLGPNKRPDQKGNNHRRGDLHFGLYRRSIVGVLKFEPILTAGIFLLFSPLLM